MTGTWHTADTHFQHVLVANLRGFATPEEHDAEIVRRWNKIVKPGDTVWHHGDVAMRVNEQMWETLEQLNGDIHLITGNHDPVWPGHRHAHRHQREWMTRRFCSLQPFARRKLNGNQVLLSHFPYDGDHTGGVRYAEYRLKDLGKWLLHGHVHDAWRQRGRQINVGLDAWDLAPIDSDTLVELISSRKGSAERLGDAGR